ncbi:MAG TPA: cytochrome c peroxidase [Xanthomonadales bacterium]|nr:cytochrome c peroxidase [Xanthomonadales bacterium]
MTARPLAALALVALAQAVCAQALRPLGPPPVPAGNPMTRERIELGRALFWDEQLSGTGTVACGTCHRPAAGGSDPRNRTGEAVANPGFDAQPGTADDVRGSPGVPLHARDGSYLPDPVFGYAPQVGGRRSPSAVAAAYASLLFWDGRAGGRFVDPDSGVVLIESGGALENQSLGPVVNDVEMAHVGTQLRDVAARVARVRPLALADRVPASLAAFVGESAYPALFARAFGTPDVTPARIAMAIASYERTLVPDATPLDRELAGMPALTATERAGLAVFRSAGCVDCHGGALLADDAFHNLGLRPDEEDAGRAAISGDARDRGAFRTPSLRNVGLRAPFMHDGRFATLEEVVAFYDRGGDFASPARDPLMRPLGLTAAERDALATFLRDALTDPRAASEAPPFDRPRLFSEGPRVPRVQGASRAGRDGRTPLLASLEPPLAGARDFTVTIAGGTPNARAVIVAGTRDPGLAAQPPVGDVANLALALDATGGATATLVLPGEPGVALGARVFVADGDGWSVSPQLAFATFGPYVGTPTVAPRTPRRCASRLPCAPP